LEILDRWQEDRPSMSRYLGSGHFGLLLGLMDKVVVEQLLVVAETGNIAVE